MSTTQDPPTDAAVSHTSHRRHIDRELARPSRLSAARVRSAAADLIVLALVVVAIAIPNSPGRINADTESMIDEARSGRITDWHSAMLEVVSQPFIRHLPIGFFFACQTLVLIGASLAIARRHLRPVSARVLLVVLWLNPLNYAYAGQFTRDVWLLAGLLATIACYEWAAAMRARGGHGWIPLILTVLSVFVTIASRQNAAAFLAPLAALVVWRHYGTWSSGVRWRHPHRCEPPVAHAHSQNLRQGRRLLVTAIATVLVLVVPLIALTEVQPLFGVKRTYPQTAIMVTDLLDYSFYSGKVHIPPSITSPGLTIGDIYQFGSPYHPDLIFYGTQKARVYDIPLTGNALVQTEHAWKNLVTHHTIRYLKDRTHLFLREIAFTGPTRYSYVSGMIANNAGLKFTHPHLAMLATNYMAKASTPNTVAGRWLTRTWLWGLLALAGAFLMWRRGLPALALTLSGWFYVLGGFVGAPGLQWRFVSPSVIVFMGVVLAVIATEGTRIWQMRSGSRGVS